MKKLFCLFVFLFVGSANATVITTVTSSDLTVYDSDNDGLMDSALSATDGFIRVFGIDSVQRGVWEYDLSSVSSGASINSVDVLFEDRGTTRSGEVFLYGFAGDGVASISDGDFISDLIGSFSLGANSSNLDYNVSLNTSFFQGLINTSATFAGIVMVSSDESIFGPGADICSFDSPFGNCSGTTGSSLTIDFDAVTVPEPSILALFGLGLAGIGFSRKKKVS